MPKTLWMIVLASMALSAQAACPTWPSAERFELHGQEVIDLRTGLVWQRCSAGQLWDGSTCTGAASTPSLAEALALARQANPTDSPVGWRLPSVKELLSLADMGCTSPAIDAAVFPATPNEDAWSSTPLASRSNVAWAVNFARGGTSGESGIGNPKTLRLVRSAQ